MYTYYKSTRLNNVYALTGRIFYILRVPSDFTRGSQTLDIIVIYNTHKVAGPEEIGNLPRPQNFFVVFVLLSIFFRLI